MRYVAFLGSINVGGNRLKMVDLRDAIEHEGFEDIETVVASGNLLFTHDERPSDGIAEKMAFILHDRFGIRSFAAIRNRAELAAAIAENPFGDDGDPKKVHTLFASERYDPEQFAAFAADYAGPERVAAGTRAYHVDFVDGVGVSRLATLVDQRFDFRATARNMNSMRRILEKMD